MKQLHLSTTPCSPPLPIKAIDDQPIGSGLVTQATTPITLQVGALHTESLSLLIIENTVNDVIFGIPWLAFHDPHISWSKCELLNWGSKCFSQCLSVPTRATTIESPPVSESPDIPPAYHDVTAVFCKKSATCLPPHRPWDCAIDLIPGSTPPRGRIYPLSLPESQAMEAYVEEALSNGFIRPSTSPAAASFFFIEKKDGGLRPCIDCRGLNNITVKF